MLQNSSYGPMGRLYPEKPLCIDLFCGLGGWSSGFLAEGYRCVGFDIERHDYGTGGYPCELVLRDVRSIHGADLIREYGIPAVMVGSSPCQEFSYRAMPWKRAKALPPPYLGMELFQAQFRIQREVSEAAGRYIPMVVENVRGAQKWVGRAKWHFGSYFLWGDVPALIPMTVAGVKVPSFRFDRNGGSFRTASVRRTNVGNVARFTSRDCGLEGIKQHGSGREWFAGEGKISRVTSSGSPLRRAASAQIAKIPYPLAVHIARCFKP
jgi:hypothetical protein